MTTAFAPNVTSTQRQVPEGWASEQFGALFAPSKERIEPQECPTAPYLSLEHVESNTGKIIGHGLASDVKSTKSVFRAGDVLYGKLRPYLNKACTPDFDGVCSTDFLVFSRRPFLESRFLQSFLLRAEFVEFANHHSTGVQLPRVNFEPLATLELPVPPLSEQRRIVAKIDELLAHLNTTRERLTRVSVTLKRFRQAVLTAACSGRLTADWRAKNTAVESCARAFANLKKSASFHTIRRGVPEFVDVPDELSESDLPDTWSIESVAALLRISALEDLKDGNHGSNHPKAKEFVKNGLPFITAAQVKNYSIDYDGAPKVAGEPLKRLKVGFARVGDAVLTHKGTVGRAALNVQDCVLTPQTTYYRCNSAVIDPSFLVYFFTSRQFYSQLAAVMSQTTRDFVPISEQYHLFLIIPPIQEQREVVRRVEALFKLADTIEQRLAAANQRVEKLTQAILAKAFRGELVPTEAELARREGRSYESAAELLERIRSKSAESNQRSRISGSNREMNDGRRRTRRRQSNSY